MLNLIETFFRKSRRWFSRSEWLIRLLRLTKTGGAAYSPGLVLIQIDGLSRHQLERAMAKGQLPFLRELLRRHKYRLHTLYSGLPSSTPAMTAELLYGVKSAVPGFSFYDRTSGTVHRMFEPRSAEEIERRLQGQGEPLLVGGSAYAGIYTGGADEVHFCASAMGLDSLFRVTYPLRLFIIVLFSIYSWVRVVVLLGVEFFLALFDCVRGLIAGQDLWMEVRFIGSRVGVTILLRELATIGAKIDVARGLPVIYLDLVGYDEQSHRRGPDSRFAHWSLKGIDNAISRISKAAQRSPQRDYDVWIFSDHGSTAVASYPRQNGRSLREAIAQVFDEATEILATEHDDRGIQSKRMHSYLRRRGAGHTVAGPGQLAPSGSTPVVAAMGPVGHIYVGEPLKDEERQELAERLVAEARIPMVSIVDGRQRVHVRTRQGWFVLPEDASPLFGPEHPFLPSVAEDFVAVCRHPNAGDFVLWGWSRDGPPCTFPAENGSHAGPGPEETRAFALLPDDAPLFTGDKPYPRPLDLRKAALRHLGRDGSPPAFTPRASTEEGILRVLTYNVHSCIGIDGNLSPQRVARVIARYRPDVVALQEVDVARRRTGRTDQAQIIARCLNMDYHFHPTVRIAGEAYGDCILSRLPMRLIKMGTLPTLPQRDSVEPRGALWVAINLDGRVIQLVNTHLGLNARERRLQMQTLLGQDWLGGEPSGDPVIFCGDFNASPRSSACRLCLRKFRDVQREAPGGFVRRTWFGHYPIARVDHIFVDSRIEVVQVEVGNDHLSRVASDHRPVFAELRVKLKS
jgi:endonuclease/exonuclease/phosphatase family metal-dependent hydrolase